MSKLKKTLVKAVALHMKGKEVPEIARELGIPLDLAREFVASVNGFTESQKNDFCIMMSMTTQEEIEEWRDHVGEEDAMYGAALMELASINVLDFATARGPFGEARALIEKVKQ